MNPDKSIKQFSNSTTTSNTRAELVEASNPELPNIQLTPSPIRHQPRLPFGFLTGLLGLFLFFLPYLILGQDSVWPVNEYLELVVPWYKLLIEQKALFSPNHTPITGMLDQLPRGVFASEFFFKTWLFYLFQPFTAILLNKIIIHLIAYLSMFHGLSRLPSSWINPRFIGLYALVWATFPFWPESGIATAALPTIFYVFFRLDSGAPLKASDTLIIFGYTFYTLLHLQGLFVGIAIATFGLIRWIQTGQIKKSYWLAFVLFTGLSCLFNYRHFLLFFLDPQGFVPHRIEYDSYSFTGFHTAYFPALWQYLRSGILHSTAIPPVLFPLSLFLLIIGLSAKQIKSPPFRISAYLVALFFIAGAVAVLSRYIPFLELIHLKFATSFSYDRFAFLTIPLLFLAVILLIDRLRESGKPGKITHGLALATLIFFTIGVQDETFKNKLLKPITGLGYRVPTYREFYAEEQFQKIKNAIASSDYPEAKVGSIGIHPAVSIFNGLPALDGYTGNYPLAYKHRFAQIILPEISKQGTEEDIYLHFMGWGNKCYLYNLVHEDMFLRAKWYAPLPLDQVSYDWEAFKSMGGRFIISSDLIYQNSGLKLLDLFEEESSAWTIYLYEVV